MKLIVSTIRDRWIVEFFGTLINKRINNNVRLGAEVWKNGVYKETYIGVVGQANKTTALRLVKKEGPR